MNNVINIQKYTFHLEMCTFPNEIEEIWWSGSPWLNIKKGDQPVRAEQRESAHSSAFLTLKIVTEVQKLCWRCNLQLHVQHATCIAGIVWWTAALMCCFFSCVCHTRFSFCCIIFCTNMTLNAVNLKKSIAINFSFFISVNCHEEALRYEL